MATTASVPFGGVATEEGRSFLQQRIALFSRTILVLYGIVFIAAVAMFHVFPEVRPTRAHLENVLAVAGIAVFGGVWLLVRRRSTYTATTLLCVDGAVVIGAGAVLGVGVYLAADRAVHMHVPFIFALFIVFARVLIVPSAAWRTGVISTVALLPCVAASCAVAAYYPEAAAMPWAAFVLGTALVAAVGIALATIGSRVIYGLRQQVQKARQLGQYTLIEKIGEGGMGIVYRAQHAMLRRPTAIKLLPPAKVGQESLERFEREVQLTSELTHPNTVAIFDYGRSADGVFYYAMEYLDGVDLDTLVMRSGPQSAARVIHILIQVCGALDEAHDRGLIHRDIKPANIILCRRGRIGDVVKVVDFGLVKDLQETDVALTGNNVVAGTPEYLAPETITDPDNVGPASDLYAVAGVGYFLLSGRPLFEGKTVAEVCAHHVHTKPPPPSKRSKASVPKGLDELLLACLEKDPSDRPASARELRRALEQLPARAEWTEEDADHWWQHHSNEPPEDVRGLEAAPTVAVTIDLSNR